MNEFQRLYTIPPIMESDGDEMRHRHVLQVIEQYLHALPSDRPYVVEISEYKPRRNEQASRLWHKWLNEISAATQMTPAYTKEFIKANFGPLLGEIKKGRKTIPLLKSSADYTVAELSDVMYHTQVWSAEQHITLTQTEESMW